MAKIEPFPGELTAVDGTFIRRYKYVLTEAQEAWFKHWFPLLKNDKIMSMTGMKFSTLHRFARDFELKKDPKALHRILKAASAKTKRKCTRNGYYASLRGKAPCESAREAAALMWQEVRDGKRKHPFHILKETNPRRYKQMLKNRSESRKKLIRREILRRKWGMEPLTRLRQVCVSPYRRSQVARRYNCLKRGYILSTECHEGSGSRFVIYYDQDTERAPIFERNCMRDGFTFKPWTDD